MNESSPETPSPTVTPQRSRTLPKILLLLGVAGLAGWLVSQYGNHLSLSALAEKEDAFREYQSAHPMTVHGVAFLIYVLVTGLSLPGALFLTLTFGWLLGFGPGVLVVSFGSTAGATLAFLMSRFLLRDYVLSKFGDRLSRMNEALEREGAFYLFSLRLIPAVPFFVLNLVMGLTPIRVRTYWWVSQIGMLPGTAVYVYAGASVPDLATLAEKGTGGIMSPQLWGAFILLGLFPILVRKIMNRFRPAPASISSQPS